jgi:hypothetical protein
MAVGYHRADISQIEIRVWGKGPESCPDALYWVAESVAGQADHLMAFGDQDTSNRKQRIEMACCRSRRKENFHVNLSLRVLNAHGYEPPRPETGPLTGSSKEDAAGSGLRREFGSGEMVTVATQNALYRWWVI